MECAHRNCTCLVDADSRFCSDRCEREADELEVGTVDPADAVEMDCGCGHAECRGAAPF
jgi:hypothetical protein